MWLYLAFISSTWVEQKIETVTPCWSFKSIQRLGWIPWQRCEVRLTESFHAPWIAIRQSGLKQCKIRSVATSGVTKMFPHGKAAKLVDPLPNVDNCY